MGLDEGAGILNDKFEAASPGTTRSGSDLEGIWSGIIERCVQL